MRAHMHGGPKDGEVVDLPDGEPAIYVPGDGPDPNRPADPDGYEIFTYVRRRPTFAHRLEMAERGLPHIDACFIYLKE